MTAANTEHLYLTQKIKYKLVWKVLLNHSYRSENFLIRNVTFKEWLLSTIYFSSFRLYLFFSIYTLRIELPCTHKFKKVRYSLSVHANPGITQICTCVENNKYIACILCLKNKLLLKCLSYSLAAIIFCRL